MELVRLNNKICEFDFPLVATIGQFDGIHLGHLRLLKKTIEIGKIKNFKTAVISFDPHPDVILRKNINNSYLLNFNDKEEILSKLGFDYLIIIDFNLNVANMDAKTFVDEYLIKQNVKEVVVGQDFIFGKLGNAKGYDILSISNGLVNVFIVDDEKINDEKISSSNIKALLLDGSVDTVKSLLGRYYSIEGQIGYGKQIGKKILVPTANLEYDFEYALLKKGVYATIVKIEDNLYFGITNYGNNPSFNYSKAKTLETHILDFSKDIYGYNMKVYFIKYLRNEVKFSSIDEFKNQIMKDKIEAKKVLTEVLKGDNKF